MCEQNIILRTFTSSSGVTSFIYFLKGSWSSANIRDRIVSERICSSLSRVLMYGGKEVIPTLSHCLIAVTYLSKRSGFVSKIVVKHFSADSGNARIIWSCFVLRDIGEGVRKVGTLLRRGGTRWVLRLLLFDYHFVWSHHLYESFNGCVRVYWGGLFMR